MKIYVNGQAAPLAVNLDDLNQTFQTSEPLRIGAGAGLRNRFHGAIADVRIYRAALAAAEVELIATPDAVAAIRAVPPVQRTPRQARKLRRCFLDKYAPAPLREARQKLLALRNERRRLIEGFPTTMVMEEMPQPCLMYLSFAASTTSRERGCRRMCRLP